MRKVTYTNLVNNLSAEFSSEDPLMHLDLKGFDGASVGARTVTYRPVGLDGQKLVSAHLNARTITLPVEFAARENGRYSRQGALAVWESLLRVFVPLHEGRLTWTDGTRSRRINCRLAETPQLTQRLPFLFGATFSLVADYPYWEDCTEQTASLSTGETQINNTCGIAVPFCVELPAGGQPAIVSATAGKGIGFAAAPPQACTVDMRECTVTLADGTNANNLLTVNSEFFTLAPGVNTIRALDLGTGGTALRWRALYMGVN